MKYISNNSYFATLFFMLAVLGYLMGKYPYFYWVWILVGLVWSIGNRKAFTGYGWFEKKEEREDIPNYSQAELLPLNEVELEGYKELAQFCGGRETEEKLKKIFDNLMDYTGDEEFMTTLNYVMDYSDNHDINFIAGLDWKSDPVHLDWRTRMLLQDNYEGYDVILPAFSKYGENIILADDMVLQEFDAALRVQGLQYGLIDTKSDEVVFLIHRTSDIEAVERAVDKIGYDYQICP